MALFDISQLAVDPKKSNEGVWVEFYGTGVEFLIARHGNRNAVNARSVGMLNIYKTLKHEDPEVVQAKTQEVHQRVLAEHVLLNWRGMSFEGSGEYTPERAYKLLSDPRYEDITNFIINQSVSSENFSLENEDEVTEDVKTSADS